MDLDRELLSRVNEALKYVAESRLQFPGSLTDDSQLLLNLLRARRMLLDEIGFESNLGL